MWPLSLVAGPLKRTFLRLPFPTLEIRDEGIYRNSFTYGVFHILRQYILQITHHFPNTDVRNYSIDLR